MAVARGGWLDRKYRRALEQVGPNLLGTVLAVVVAATPFVPEPTALPCPSDPGPLANRTHLQSLVTTTLAGQDLVYGAPGQAPEYDWPNPRGRPAGPLDNRSWLVNATSYAPAPAGEVYTELPPRGPQRSSSLNTWTASSTGLIGQDSIYGDPGQVPDYAWPLPPPARPFPTELRTWTCSSLALSLLAPDAGIPVGEASVALPPQPVARLRIATTQAGGLRLVGQDVLYGAPGQVPTVVLPNPRGPLAGATSNLSHLVNGTVYLEPVGQRLTDLSPKGRVPLNQGYVQATPIQLIGQDQIYGGSGQVPDYAWPNPRGRPTATALRTWLANGTAYAEQTPAVQRWTDLPPSGPRRAPQYEQGRNLQPLFELAAAPLPPGETSLALPPKGRAPINRGQTQAGGLRLVGLDRIYGGPGQVPTVNLPNPPPGPRQNPQYEQGRNLQPLLNVPPPAFHLIAAVGVMDRPVADGLLAGPVAEGTFLYGTT